MKDIIAVEIKKVSKQFGTVKALDSISLKIKRGDFFALLGPSGCGKTTLLRIVGGFESPSDGDILIEGKSVLRQPPYLRATNMVFQHLALFPHMVVFDNVAFGLKMKGFSSDEISKRVGDALELVKLEQFHKRRIDQLSGGQKQRVAIARALVNNPSVLLLDEPLGSLDLQLRLQMHEELRRLHRSLESTFIFVTHDQAEAITMSNRIGVMNEGRLLQVGTPEEIYGSPQKRFVAQFIGHTNMIEGKVAEDLGNWNYIIDWEKFRLPCHTPLKLQLGKKVALALRYEKIKVNPIESGEDIAITGKVLEKTYMGSITRLDINLENEIIVTADLPSNEFVESIKIGRKVKVSWLVESLTVLED